VTLGSDEYLREVLLPEIYSAVKNKIETHLQTAEFIFVTTDR